MNFALESRDDSFSHYLCEILQEKCTMAGLHFRPNNPDLVICVGGDGTILRAIHKYMHCLDKVYFVGIHTGTLGFLTDYNKEEINSFIYDIKNGPIRVDESTLLEITIPSQHKTLYALNEVRIEAMARTLSFDVYIDDEFFERCTGSGICISTQAGSTAINRALHGAVIDQGLDALQLCEIMPISHKGHHSLGNPYIMNTDRKILLVGQSLSHARVCYDHMESSLEGVTRVEIRAAQKKVRFIRYRTCSYLKRLKSLY